MDAVGARSLLGKVELELGDHDGAERYARAALELADEHALNSTPTYAYGRAILGQILVARGNAEEANEELSEALPSLRALGEPLSIAETLLAPRQRATYWGGARRRRRLLREAGAIIDGLRDPGYLRDDAPRRRPAGRRPTSARSRAVSSTSSSRCGRSHEARPPTGSSSRTTRSTPTSARSTRSWTRTLPEAVARARQLGLSTIRHQTRENHPGETTVEGMDGEAGGSHTHEASRRGVET